MVSGNIESRTPTRRHSTSTRKVALPTASKNGIGVVHSLLARLEIVSSHCFRRPDPRDFGWLLKHLNAGSVLAFALLVLQLEALALIMLQLEALAHPSWSVKRRSRAGRAACSASRLLGLRAYYVSVVKQLQSTAGFK